MTYDEIYVKDHTLNTSTPIRLTRNNYSDTPMGIYGDIVLYTNYLTNFGYNATYINLSNEINCGDCDDMNATINPGMIENSSINNGTCGNKFDDDCDGKIDCLDPGCTDSPECILFCSPREDLCDSPPCCSNTFDDDCDSKTDCADEDCFNDLSCTGNATLHGYVFDDQEWPIDLATVTGFPPFKPLVTTFTDIFGFYNYTVPSGVYNFKADKFGYDPDIDELTLPNGTNVEHNFTLHNATCHNDCTNSEGRCNKDCEGYTYQSNSCHYNTTQTANACNDKRKSTTQTLQQTDEWFLLVDCCEGTPYYQWRPKLTVTGNMEDLYKLTSIVSIGGEPAKLHINVWRK